MWRAMVKVAKWSGISLGTLVLIYLVFVLLALGRRPIISVDYLPILNEQAAAVSAEDAAWPMYREAAAALLEDEEPWDDAGDSPRWPYRGGWEQQRAWLAMHARTLDLARAASAKPGMGLLARHEPLEEDAFLYSGSGPAWGTGSTMDESLLGVVLPHYGTNRRIARLLMADARQAAFEGDGGRFVEDVQAALALAHHNRELPLLIGDLVSMSIASMVVAVVGESLAVSPQAFADEDLAVLTDSLAAADELYFVRFEGERLMFLDMLQRTYTDDGDGDGVVSPTALEAMELVSSVSQGDGQAIGSVFLAPLAQWIMASRQESLAEYDRLLGDVDAIRTVPLRDYVPSENEVGVETRHRSLLGRWRYLMVDLLVPALDRAAMSGKYAMVKRDALLAAIALEQHRRETGDWPTTLGAAMDDPPIDPWTGEPIGLAFHDGRPVLYSVGNDRNDDAGMLDDGTDEVDEIWIWRPYLEPDVTFESHFSAARASTRAINWMAVDASGLPDGDWILWPPILE